MPDVCLSELGFGSVTTWLQARTHRKSACDHSKRARAVRTWNVKLPPVSPGESISFCVKENLPAESMPGWYLCGVCQHGSNLQSTLDNSFLHLKDQQFLILGSRLYFMEWKNKFNNSPVKTFNVNLQLHVLQKQSTLFSVHHPGTLIHLCGFFVRAALQSHTGLLKSFFSKLGERQQGK